MSAGKPLIFSGHANLRMRLVMATLTGQPIKVENIRSEELEPGLKDYEVSFLRLLESVTNGTVVEISYTGTSLIYRPGIIIGGTHQHNCPLSRGIGWFIEPLLMLAPFGKSALSLTLRGITSNDTDIGVDTIRTVLFPIMKKFGIEREELRILKRGSPPHGGGEVNLYLPHLVLQPKTLHAITSPIIARLRGIAYSTRVSPDNVNRIVDAARDVLRPTKCETYIYTDVARGDESGKSPGFGVTLVAETKTGWCFAAEEIGKAGTLPEDVGTKAASELLEEVSMGGTICRMQTPLVLIFMALGREDIGRLRIGKSLIDAKFVQILRDIKTFFGLEARIRDAEDNDNELLLSLKGSGFISASKKIA